MNFFARALLTAAAAVRGFTRAIVRGPRKKPETKAAPYVRERARVQFESEFAPTKSETLPAETPPPARAKTKPPRLAIPPSTTTDGITRVNLATLDDASYDAYFTGQYAKLNARKRDTYVGFAFSGSVSASASDGYAQRSFFPWKKDAVMRGELNETARERRVTTLWLWPR